MTQIVFLEGSYVGVLVETHLDHGVTMLVVRTPGGTVKTLPASNPEQRDSYVRSRPDIFSVDQVRLVHPERLENLQREISDRRRSGDRERAERAEAMYECLKLLDLAD